MTTTLDTHDPVLHDFAENVGTEGAVAVEGARTRWTVGGTLDDGVRLLRAPSGIVDYKPEEMTVTVRAGTTVEELHAALAERGQRTALPERGGTVGGALAVGENDIRAAGRGFVRTSLLQLRYVSAEGRVVSSGGPTVKNVSGFDLPRLFVGSLGTLGLIAEVILRTNPIPALSRWVRTTDISPATVLDTVLAPSAVLWDGTATWVELEGHEPDVEAELIALGEHGHLASAEGPPPLPDHRWSRTPAEALTAPPGATSFVSVAGIGLVFADTPQPPRPVEPALDGVARRIKQNFDPTARLNPGRMPGSR